YVDFNGNLDAAIAIRTMFTKGNTAWFQAGAGIVVDSDPDDEHLECQNKAAALVAALPTARRMTAQRLAGQPAPRS
ncbi:MAG: chorismate-binding protein, partial [Ilumatobacteraceae bacterium]